MYAAVTANTFSAAFGAAQYDHPLIAKMTSDFEDDGNTLFYLAADDASGFGIREGELVFVFSMVRGRGDALVEAAIFAGAVRLDCFDGYLVDLYRRHGFVEYDRAENWTPGEPDVVWMGIPTSVTRARCADHGARFHADLGGPAAFGCPSGCTLAHADIYLEHDERWITDGLGYLTTRTFNLA